MPNSSDRRSQGITENSAVLLFVKERQKFLRFVRSSVRDADLAEEIVQRASVKIVSRSSTLREAARAEAWIYRLLRNEITDHFRRLAVEHKRMAELSREVSPEISFEALASAAFDHTNPCPCAIQELERLPRNYSEVLRSVEMDGEPIVSLAARRGESANTTTVRVHRARKSLRSRLLMRCGACAGTGCFDCSCAI